MIRIASTLAAVAIAFSIAGCANILKKIDNPITGTTLYEVEIAFDGSLKTFNSLKGLCARRALPPACRTYVLKGREIIPKVYAADKSAREFVTNYPTVDATNVIQAVTGLVGKFKDNLADLSATK